MSMKTYLKTNRSFTRNCLLSGLRFVTAPLFTCLAALFISVTTPAVASGPSANPDAPTSTFVTSTPQAPPPVRYMLIELRGRTSFDISQSGQIVGQFFNADFSVNPAVFWPNSNAAPIYLHVLSNKLFTSVATSINASGNILGDACDQAEFECHAVFWANSTSTPVALASPGGGF